MLAQNWQQKAFNDPIHGTIILHPLLVKVIDTPQFQRLRYLKQLGGSYFVYPGASHNRFEHCIGTAYLAGKFCRALRRNHELDRSNHDAKKMKLSEDEVDVNITDRDILCVEMAGLCHDLGHGPFSHMFDHRFMHEFHPEWSHEEQSCKMLDYLLRENDMAVKPNENDEGKFTEKEINFIKEMIAGPKKDKKKDDWKYEGLSEDEKDKEFLYDIVSNEVNKVDVDKWDYFARDCHHLGVATGFDHMRFMKFARVRKVKYSENGQVKERTQICVRDKEMFNLYEMFHTRNVLHRRAYQHRVAQGIEIMIADAFRLANDDLELPESNGEKIKISDAFRHPSMYTYLTDYILHQIFSYCGNAPNLKEAKKIVERIYRRDIYRCVGEIRLQRDEKNGEEECRKKKQEIIKSEKSLDDEDLVLDAITFNYGMKEENPINYFRFFDKEGKLVSQDKMKKYNISSMLPSSFQDREIRVYCKKGEKCNQAKNAFQNWEQKQLGVEPVKK